MQKAGYYGKMFNKSAITFGAVLNIMKKITLTAASLLVASLLFTACKKDDKDNPTPSNNYGELLVGKWYTAAAGFDVNGNNTMDSGELSPIDSAFQQIYTEYYSDGTGKGYGIFLGMPVDTTNMTWTIVGDNYLKTVPSAAGSYLIYELNTTTLILKDTSEHPNQWISYDRM